MACSREPQEPENNLIAFSCADHASDPSMDGTVEGTDAGVMDIVVEVRATTSDSFPGAEPPALLADAVETLPAVQSSAAEMLAWLSSAWPYGAHKAIGGWLVSLDVGTVAVDLTFHRT